MLEYTGERMVPEEADRYTFWAHIYRYRFALDYVKGKRVLDIACGEGYGSGAMLAGGAASVVGVDISPEACAHAQERYGIECRVGNAEAIPLQDHSVDAVVSFETVEHVADAKAFVAECVRVLSPGGRLIISTPNVEASRLDAHDNPFHIKEFDEASFRSLLQAGFHDLQMFTQQPKVARWLSLRTLARDRPRVRRVPGFGSLQRLVQSCCCPEVIRNAALVSARQAPVAAICAAQKPWASLGNPFSVRRLKPATREVPGYFIAVVTAQS